KRMIFMPSVMVRTFLSLVLIASFSGCLKPGRPDPARIEGQQNTCSTTSLSLGENESLVSIIGTNDIHGTIQPKKVSIVKDQPAKLVGGMAFFAGAMKAIRDGVEKKYGEKGGVLLLDGGDQFQGTLLSNYSEGHLMFSLMNE